MAKKKRGKSEKDLDNINNAVSSILEEYKIVPKKDKKAILKRLKKQSKEAKKEYENTNNFKYKIEYRGTESRIKKIEKQTDRIFINYGIVDLHVKASYLDRIKNKEQYLDGLFNRKMKTIMNNISLDSVADAKEYESLITQYTKKIKSTKFYDVEMVENSINKLTNYRNKINNYDYSFFINEKRQRIQGEVYESRQKDNIKELEKSLKKATVKEAKKIKKEIKEIKLEIRKNYISETQKSIKRQIKNKQKNLESKKIKDEVKIGIAGDIEDLEQELADVENDTDGNLIDSEENTIEQQYKAVEKPILIDGWLMGIQFNFF